MTESEIKSLSDNDLGCQLARLAGYWCRMYGSEPGVIPPGIQIDIDSWSFLCACAERLELKDGRQFSLYVCGFPNLVGLRANDHFHELVVVVEDDQKRAARLLAELMLIHCRCHCKEEPKTEPKTEGGSLLLIGQRGDGITTGATIRWRP